MRSLRQCAMIGRLALGCEVANTPVFRNSRRLWVRRVRKGNACEERVQLESRNARVGKSAKIRPKSRLFKPGIKPPHCRIWVPLRPRSLLKIRFGQGEMMGVAMSGPLRFRFAAVLDSRSFFDLACICEHHRHIAQPYPRGSSSACSSQGRSGERRMPVSARQARGRPALEVSPRRQPQMLVPGSLRRPQRQGSGLNVTGSSAGLRRARKTRPRRASEKQWSMRVRNSSVPAPEETLQPRPVPAMKVVDARAFRSRDRCCRFRFRRSGCRAGPATGAAALVPPPPVLAQPDPLPPQRSSAPQDFQRASG